MSNLPLISIVTPCLNRGKYVAEAIESVLAQNYPNFEHIITDGGSTDGTLEILKRYPHLRVISEPDENLYDALNKGISLAKGDVIGHLNTDDRYEPGIFTNVAETFRSDESIETVFGRFRYFIDSSESKKITPEEGASVGSIDHSFRQTVVGHIGINAHFFRRSAYERLGYYDVRYPITADRDFLIRASLEGIRELFLNRYVYRYRRHEKSITFNKADFPIFKVANEHLAIAERLLERENLTDEQRRVVKNWHSRQTFFLIMHSLRTHSWSGLWKHSGRGIKHNLLWPVALVVAGAYLLTGQKDRY